MANLKKSTGKTVNRKLKEGEIIDFGNGKMGIAVTRGQLIKAVTGTTPNISTPPEKYELAEGGLVARETMAPTFFDEDPYMDAKGRVKGVHSDIVIAKRYFYIDPVGRIIELMAQMADDGFRNEDVPKKARKFFKAWMRSVDFSQVVHRWFLEHGLTANVTVRKKLVPFTPKVRKSMSEDSSDREKLAAQRDAIEQYEKTHSARKDKWTNKMIPGAYTELNPVNVYVESTGGLAREKIFFQVDEDLRRNYQKNAKDYSDLDQDIKDGLSGKSGLRIELDPELTFRITREKSAYEDYAVPLMRRAFRYIYMKHKMEQLDLHTISGILSQLIVITVGDKDAPAKVAHLKALNKTLRRAAKSPVLLWNHTLKVDVPDMRSNAQLDASKFEHYNEQIRNAFGISGVLMGSGGKGSFSSEFLGVEGFNANIRQMRKDISAAASKEYEIMGDVLGLDSVPNPTFDPQLLRDRNRHAQVMATMVQAGIMSYRTAVETCGYDFDAELENMKQERAYIEEGTLGRPMSPFQSPSGAPNANAPKSDPRKGRPITATPSQAPREEPRRPVGQGSIEWVMDDEFKKELGKIVEAFEQGKWDLYAGASNLSQPQIEIAKKNAIVLFPYVADVWKKKYNVALSKNKGKKLKELCNDICLKKIAEMTEKEGE